MSIPVCIIAIAVFAVQGESDYTARDIARMRAHVNSRLVADPETKGDVDTFLAVLDRCESEPDSLTASEKQILEALDKDSGLGTRGKVSGRLAAILGKKKAKEPEDLFVDTPQPLPALRSKPVFRSGVRSAPKGRKIGFVEMRLNGRSTTLVEIFSTAGGSQAKRAAIVRDRIATAHRGDPLWWMKLTVGASNGETVVKYPRLSTGYIVTADRRFADQCSVDTRGLARLLIYNIRNGYERKPSGLRGDVTSEEIRAQAVTLRQEGDVLFATDRNAAAEKYRLAFSPAEGDPAYLVPYLRLAELLASDGKLSEAKVVLQTAASEPSMSEADRAKAKSALRDLG
jgi:hypothetical protein